MTRGSLSPASTLGASVVARTQVESIQAVRIGRGALSAKRCYLALSALLLTAGNRVAETLTGAESGNLTCRNHELGTGLRIAPLALLALAHHETAKRDQLDLVAGNECIFDTVEKKIDEFADLASYLLSQRASYVTGVGISLDGGLSPAI